MNNFLVTVVCATTAALMMGCGGGVSQLTKERVARSETTVQQATQAMGNSEAGAIELQRAKDSLARAKQAVEAKNEQRADRMAQQAQLDAELALAKAQTADSRRAANEVLASVETLRKEAARTTP